MVLAAGCDTPIGVSQPVCLGLAVCAETDSISTLILYIYIEGLIAFTQVCKIRLTVLRDSSNQGFLRLVHVMK